MKLALIASLLVAVTACGKTANPAVCCADRADCAAIGVDEDMRSCASDLACVDNACVAPSCELQGCEPTVPVCNIVTDRCEGCAASADCDGFEKERLCDLTDGACVQCIEDADCPATLPVCDGRACRQCVRSFECLSGACGDDGTCVTESKIVYLDPAGSDTGDCARNAPCRTLAYAVMQTTPLRDHIVMAQGAYTMPFETQITSQHTAATRLFLHGGASSVTESTGEVAVMRVSIPISIRDLRIEGSAGLALGSPDGLTLLERVLVQGSTFALALGAGATTLRDVAIIGSGAKQVGISIGPETTLRYERGLIRDFDTCVAGAGTMFPNVNMVNVLIHGCAQQALALGNARGLIEFTTIANSGTDMGTGPRAVTCSSEMTFRSSIIWAPGATARVPISGCNLVSSIAGPTAVPGASNADPRFYEYTTDFNLRPESPARDLVDVGPPTDSAGQPRPLGPRFDIGALEAAP